ncbi:two-component system response regulator [Pseudoalteromonas sp. A25]|uniref:HD domain-containing phosphohydrolase n=1 Tax=Pseudoalteromonas sp. A25 TaxID=116092 RepID=UPI0012A0A710|nr:HD domain-containing phosphohydrolase [Pseudoalteromonas sp. A25]BBN83821.1 two-component system response regulator [Pseudoalteromonas sp. A25]
MKEIRNNSVILAIDDNPTNLKLLDRLLSAKGYKHIHLLSDSRDAVSTYLDLQPDLILLDINMPHLDGFEVMDALFALEQTLVPPIVVISAQQCLESTLKALQKGARDYVTKPFEKNELLMRVQNLLDAHLAHKMLNDQAQVLEKMVDLRTKELHDTRLSVVQRLGMAAEYKDEETGNHILRMSHMCMLLARKLGWSDYQCELLLHASPMHDIGKIGIPDSVLLKPGPLDPEQWEVMKKHAQIGGELLSGDTSDLMIMAKNIALCHHEKWDGSGYPSGLKNEQIPIEGRIAAIADVFDALTSVRPYKDAWQADKAIGYIQEQSGRHFEPRLVEIFVNNIEEIINIKNQFQDQ